MEASGMSRHHWFSNKEADWRAGAAANLHQLTPQQVKQLSEADELFQSVLNRLVAIELGTQSVHDLYDRPQKCADNRALSRWRKQRTSMIRSRHMFSRNGSCWHCLTCKESAVGRSEFLAWLRRGPCTGPPERERFQDTALDPMTRYPMIQRVSGRTHVSHRLQFQRGVIICLACGCFGSSRPKGLRRVCVGTPEGSRKAALARWRRGQHPQPGGIWPQPTRAERTELEVMSESD